MKTIVSEQEEVESFSFLQPKMLARSRGLIYDTLILAGDEL